MTLTQIRADIESGALTPMQVYEAMLAIMMASASTKTDGRIELNPGDICPECDGKLYVEEGDDCLKCDSCDYELPAEN